MVDRTQHLSAREDLSQFLIHLTRDGDDSAQNNLLSILKMKCVEARNPHCLFMHDLSRLKLSPTLQKCFYSVCFTEAPLHQIKRLTARIPKRQVQLQPYGLVFTRRSLMAKGANPAVYINAEGTQLRDYLLADFRKRFGKTTTLHALKKSEQEYYKTIVQYYAQVNIVSDRHDFTWEREWRHIGDLRFLYHDLVAIIAEDPESFESLCGERLPPKKFGFIQMLPIISPEWSYEDIVAQMSIKIWNSALLKEPPGARPREKSEEGSRGE